MSEQRESPWAQEVRYTSGQPTSSDRFDAVPSQNTLRKSFASTKSSSRYSTGNVRIPDAFSNCASRAKDLMQKRVIASTGSLIERSTLEEVVVENQQRFAGCLMLLLTVIFFVTYTASVVLHEEITDGHLMEAPLRAALSQSLAEVRSIGGVWSWVDTVLLPTFFERGATLAGSDAAPGAWNRVLTYNALVGAVVLEQARSTRRPCKDELAAHMDCFPQDELSSDPFGRGLDALPPDFNFSVIDRTDEGFVIGSGGGRRLRMKREEIGRWLPASAPDDYTFRFHLHQGSPLPDVRQRVEYLRARRWLDEQTTHLAVKAIVLNPELGSLHVENVEVSFAFSRGGGVFSSVLFERFRLSAFSGPLSIAIDCLFLLVLLVFTALMIARLCAARRKGKVRMYARLPSNILAWLNLILSWVRVVLFFIEETLRASVVEKVRELGEPSASPGEHRAIAEEVHGVVGHTLEFVGWYRTVNTYVVLLLMFRCFIDLEFQPRLATVVKTLRATSIDLGHFVVIIVPTTIAYAIAGMCIFGRRVDSFSSIGRAIGTCFRIAIESEFDWEELAAEDFWTTASWVCTYLLLIVLIMLNMVMAIIMDVYTEIRAQGANSETISESLWYIVIRIRGWRHWVRNDRLLAKVKKLPEVSTFEEVRDAFPEMAAFQFEWLKVQATKRSRSRSLRRDQEKLFVHLLAGMNIGLSMAKDTLERVEDINDDAMGEEKARTACYEDIVQSIVVQNHWMASVQEQLEGLRALQYGRERGVELAGAPPDEVTPHTSDAAQGQGLTRNSSGVTPYPSDTAQDQRLTRNSTGALSPVYLRSATSDISEDGDAVDDKGAQESYHRFVPGSAPPPLTRPRADGAPSLQGG